LDAGFSEIKLQSSAGLNSLLGLSLKPLILFIKNFYKQQRKLGSTIQNLHIIRTQNISIHLRSNPIPNPS